ncbi:receptor expression-enhancing protein 3-like [Drosophila albomicans]|uniref:Receptor expression-enhancing protein n=1 Tax=Drosophila albomicans TaxID=7291 RepID=A0A6P8WS74_DROAB|nr:receptor expression-enhancing protein 3-like [Drosophila albomicans]
MIGTLLSRLMILSFGTLYPGYASYKAIRAKDVNECTKWLKYWITFAGFTCIEIITDRILFWFPLYYEIKVILVLNLTSPTIEGSSALYSKLVQPMLELHEDEIDEYISHAHAIVYSTFRELSTKGASYAFDAIMQCGTKIIHLAAHSHRDRKLNSPNQLQENSLRSSSLKGMKAFYNELMIIAELTGDDVAEDPQSYYQNKEFRMSGHDLAKLAEALKQTKKILRHIELILPRSYSTSSIDASSSRSSVINVRNQQLTDKKSKRPTGRGVCEEEKANQIDYDLKSFFFKN